MSDHSDSINDLSVNRLPNGSPEEGSDTIPPLYSGIRGLAIKILTRVDRSDSWLDKLLENTLAREQLDVRDKRLLRELTSGVMRHRERLDWVLTGFYHGEFQKCIPTVKNAMRVALYQLLFLDRIPHSAAVNESVEIIKRLKGKRSAGIVNGVLRNIIRKLDAITWPDPDENIIHFHAVMESHPQWMVKRWSERLGIEETASLLKANNVRPTTSLRVNVQRTTVEHVKRELIALGASVERSVLMPSYLHVRHIPDLGTTDVFKEGFVTAQDDGAGLAVLLSGAKPGMRVIDLCAAPGGKSTAMAELMRGEGEIIAIDKYEAKLKQLSETITRCGFEQIIQPIVGDALTVEMDQADVVLLDAPCSGLGTLRRKPEIKWKRQPEEIRKLTELQRELLERATLLVKPEGVLVYTTCTTEPEENEMVISQFLQDHPEFQIESAEQFMPDSALRKGVVTDRGFLQVWPHRHGTDGAFGARLRKSSHSDRD
ncbi:MAG: 16S rRNA (cytosine(967)-C(5))-methyltransferase RsmB [Candidatus Kapaibacterium sp.]